MIIKDKSFGIVPFHKDSKGVLYFCLIHHASGHWAFPKGHPNRGEKDTETALRELHEETGIDQVSILNDKFFSEEYTFEKSNIQYDKTVIYFLGQVQRMDKVTPDNFKKEIPELRWVTYEVAQSLITFANTKRVLCEAFQYLTSNKNVIMNLNKKSLF